ncbi:MAG TPA: glycosyltransferase family 2 protein [Xanthomonadaceae bacterium]|nr:glycosyltransferase family 2 protein [Xanthomonadaceae bacterium]
MNSTPVAVVIPCYRVADQVLPLISRIGAEVGWIFAVDDACPEGSGDAIERDCRDPRVRVLRHKENQGVGGATVTGYRAALETPARIVVKLDGDGQMDPSLIPRLVSVALAGRADYVKGNRFHRIADVRKMPRVRLLGNAVLSFLSKLSSGYWQVFDPTNGFTAIHRNVLAQLPLDSMARRYFFESDLLYQLGQLRAVVADMPMSAVYDGAPSSLRPLRVMLPFLGGHLRNLARRLLYSYFLRGFSAASLELLLAPPLLLFGAGFGLCQWRAWVASGEPATAGTVMLAALPILIGMQLLLSWLNFDVAAEPRQPIHPLLDSEGPA